MTFANVKYRQFELPVQLNQVSEDGDWKILCGQEIAHKGQFTYTFDVYVNMECGRHVSGDCMVTVENNQKWVMTDFVDVVCR